MLSDKRDKMFSGEFLTSETVSVYRERILKALNTRQVCFPDGRYSGKSAAELAEILRADVLPAAESSLEGTLEKLHPLIANSVALSHPKTIAQPHCPLLITSADTTDFGSIDPLPEIVALSRDASAWFHVDAAYGAALLLSERNRTALRGIEQADSVSMNFHKRF